MAKTDFKSIDHYIGTQPEAVRPILERVRTAIRTALPAAEETISYQIPCFKMAGRPVVYFAGWKEHYSLYPATVTVMEALGEALQGNVVSRGTIRFPLGKPVPVRLIARIAKVRAAEVAERNAAKKSGPRKKVARAKPKRASGKS